MQDAIPSTRWISAKGAERIMDSVGALPEPPDILPEFRVANRARKDYVWAILVSTARAVAEQSANPTASAPESADEDGYTPAEVAIYKWAESCARRLERILDGLA